MAVAVSDSVPPFSVTVPAASALLEPTDSAPAEIVMPSVRPVLLVEPDSVSVPAPVLVSACALPERLPLIVRELPDAVLIVDAAVSVTLPLTVLEPLRLTSAPPPAMPVPASPVIASATVMPPCKASTAPLVTEVPPAAVPSAVLFAAITVPVEMVVAPV